MEFPGGVNAAATLRKTNVHQNDIWMVCGRLCNRSGRGRSSRAHFVTQLCDEYCKMHGNDRVVLDNQHPH